MSKRGTQITILCEDLQQEVFARHFFLRRGFHHKKIKINRNTKGKGSGEQYVRSHYAEEVKNHRGKSTYLSHCLAVVIDADKHTIEERLRQLDAALEDDGQPKRQPNEKIAIFVPKRNIETWIHYLKGRAVDEETAYPKLARERECKRDIDKLVKTICPAGLPEDAPPSLHAACKELSRIL